MQDNSKLCLNSAKSNISGYLLYLDDMYTADKRAFKLLLADKILPKIFNMDEFKAMQNRFKVRYLDNPDMNTKRTDD